MENYYNNSSRWEFDSDGNYLHSKRTNNNPNTIREGYLFVRLEARKSTRMKSSH